MSGPDSPAVTVEGAAKRWSPWWVAAGVLFFASALIVALRSFPGPIDVPGVLLIATSVTFSLALVAAAIASAQRAGAVALSRNVRVALILLAIWILIGPPLLVTWFGVSSTAPIYIDALVKLGLSGVIVAGVRRSTMPAPWNYVPALALAAVVLALLMEFSLMSGAVSDMNVLVLISNVLLLTRIIATGALGAAALKAARARAGSVVVFGADR